MKKNDRIEKNTCERWEERKKEPERCWKEMVGVYVRD